MLLGQQEVGHSAVATGCGVHKLSSFKVPNSTLLMQIEHNPIVLEIRKIQSIQLTIIIPISSQNV
jgi:hypothetical protein